MCIYYNFRVWKLTTQQSDDELTSQSCVRRSLMHQLPC